MQSAEMAHKLDLWWPYRDGCLPKSYYQGAVGHFLHAKLASGRVSLSHAEKIGNVVNMDQ
jgi:hypothetical protein